jgi:UDP-glucose:(glucosyl)LPS alpha-1,2-glucosyltransferase
MSGFEENEISINANGGTELAKRDLARLIRKELLENFQIVCSRVRNLNEKKIRIYWVHDLPQDPECKKLGDINFRKKFHKIVYVSNWQYNQFRTNLKLPYDKNDIIIENGISPIDYKQNKDTNKINLIYTSTPHRGLSILIPVFEFIKKFRKNIHLHVFSSFNIYGWPQMDNKYKELFDRCISNPDITYHGFQPYQKVRDQLSNSHIFTYPNIWEETSCRALIEAMSAGLLCVHPNYGALPDTSGNMNLKMYQGDADMQLHAIAFTHALNSAIDLYEKKNINTYLYSVKNYADNRFNLTKIVKQWEYLLEGLVQKYDTLESRKF